jgi:hypothetical protein
VLGVTGHRDLRPQDHPLLEEAVRRILRRLRDSFPSSPLVLLSALAEGADLLVAELFLREFADSRDRLVVPLPMPLEEYLLEFSGPESVRRVRAALSRAARVDLPPVAPRAGDPARPEDARALQYEQVGAFLVRHSQLVIALWDGQKSRGRGGTAEVVRFQLQGIPERYRPAGEPLDPPEGGPVFHVHTPRASSPDAPGQPGTTTSLYPGHWSAGEAPPQQMEALLLGQLEEFNRDVLRLGGGSADAFRTASEYLHSTRPGVTYAPLLRPQERHTLAVFGAADTLALQFQRRTRSAVRLLLGAGVAAVLLNQAYSVRSTQAWVVAYAVWLFTGLLALRIVQRANWHGRHLNYRGLAEGLRVQFFWQIARVGATVSDSYGRAQRHHLDAVRQALRFGDLAIHTDGDGRHEAEVDRITYVHRVWVRDQLHYFAGPDGQGGAIARDERRLRWVSRLTGAGFLAATASIAAVAAGFEVLGPGGRTLVQALSAGTLGISAAAAGYSKIMGLREHVRDGTKMAELFRRADLALTAALDGAWDAASPAETRWRMDQARAILLDLGREALAENADWLILHRSRPLEFATG